MGAPANTDEYTLMESNFAMTFGLAIQAFLRTQVSNDAPYDQWAEAPGNEARSTAEGNGRGILTAAQMRGMELFFTNTIGERGNCSTCHQGPLFTTATFPFTVEEESGEFPEREQRVERMRRGDGVNIAEDLFRYFVSGQGTVGSYTIAGTAGSRELPGINAATVGGDITLNGLDCKVESYLTNQDRTQPPQTSGSGIPPEPPGPSEFADYSTRDAVIRVSGCLPPLPPFPPISELEIRIIDGGPNPNDDTAQILPVIFGGFPAPCPVCFPIPAAYGAPIASGIVVGDFTIEVPTVYDTAFYNIGVRPTGEDPGVGADDSFGIPLSFTKQWIDQLLGTPAADVDAIRSLNFARVTEPFSWHGDSVFFPGGMAGYAWLTFRLMPNPDFGNNRCTFPFPPFSPAPGFFPDKASCEAAGFLWFMPSEFSNQVYMPIPGRGDDAVPAYESSSNVANYDAILNMPKAVDGAFKVPNLRNVTLTGPFFHNGGQGTLQQVVEFYNRGGDFAIENLGDTAPNINPLGLNAQQIDDIVAFLGALTDDDVRCKRAPFDHPEVILNEGHQTKSDGTGQQAKDKITIIDAVGAGGVRGNKCLEPFL
jgi:cytochrome c peroxidase